MVILSQNGSAFYNWDNIVDIYINRASKTEILLSSTATPEDSLGYLIGRYKNEENAETAFKKLTESILAENPIVVTPTDEEIEEYISQK